MKGVLFRMSASIQLHFNLAFFGDGGDGFLIAMAGAEVISLIPTRVFVAFMSDR